MSLAIEDYGLIGDTQTAALVGRDGSVDWLCLPRFDSEACFAALLGEERHGRWRIAPAAGRPETVQRYRDGTLVLETESRCREGTVRVVDFMPIRGRAPDIVRIVEGIEGAVPMRMRMVPRFGYGQVRPWTRCAGGRTIAVAGPDALVLDAPFPVQLDGPDVASSFTVRAGERHGFVLTWTSSHEIPAAAVDAREALDSTERWWREWAAQSTYDGPYEREVTRSLITLKAMTYAPTGGIVAAATTSLPEHLGGVRNWDYRYCWIRDATLTLYALLAAGYTQEAVAWRDWLLRAVAGDPAQMQIMYGAAGERRLLEWEADWLPGYAGSVPVRIGNAASRQFQLDVFGEVMDVLQQSRETGVEPHGVAWQVQRALMENLEGAWREPDEGIWEVRSGRRHFTHSKVMSWVAFDRAIRAVERSGVDGPVTRWRRAREEIHAEVCRRGYDSGRGAFVQSYGSQELDASLLMIALVGFLPARDPRVAGTVRAIERELCRDGFVERYATERAVNVDGLPGREGAFLPCTFWLVDNLILQGRRADARRLFEHVLSVASGTGLLSEEYDAEAGRLVGNYPQAFSHVGLVNSAHNLQGERAPARERPEHAGEAA